MYLLKRRDEPQMVIESKIPKEAEIPPTDFVIVGGTGDLALRKIFPALFHRFLDGQIPELCAYCGGS